MHRKLALIVGFWSSLLLSGCVDPFVLESSSYEELIVVDGMLSDQPGPYEVRISTSVRIDQILYKPLSQCSVWVSDESGATYPFPESAYGVYHSDSASFIGKVGMGYQLHVISPSGEEYVSRTERIRPAIGIDSVYALVESPIDALTGRPMHGFQFVVDAAEANTDTVRMLWLLEPTYAYNADFMIDFYYDGALHPFPNRDSLFTCYKTFQVPEIFTFSATGAQNNRLTGKRLHFESTQNRALSIGYSLLVRQLTISDQAMEYWTELQAISEVQGNVFGQQPFQVNGNIHDINDPEHKALGYFMAAGESQLRKFFIWNLGQFEYDVCTITDADVMAYANLPRSHPSEWPIWVTTGPGRTTRAVVDLPCIDCRTKHGVIQKPAFWP
jgi:hypothetical protein